MRHMQFDTSETQRYGSPGSRDEIVPDLGKTRIVERCGYVLSLRMGQCRGGDGLPAARLLRQNPGPAFPWRPFARRGQAG